MGYDGWPDAPAADEATSWELGENTRAVHLPAPAHQPPATASYDHPAAEAFAAAVAAMEGSHLPQPTMAQAFASGMAATSAMFWTFTQAGTHVVAPASVHPGVHGFLRNVAARFGLRSDFVDMTDLRQVQTALRPETRIVYAETLGNATAAVADLPALAGLAHAIGALLVVDSTLAPPVVCRPLEHGADLVLHSAAGYIGGHCAAGGGVVAGRPDLIGMIRDVRVDTGGSLAADQAILLRGGLETLPVRVRRQCATAMLFAAALARHPAVRAVEYPGLAHHRGYEVARRLFDAGPEGTRCGAIVTVTPHGGREVGYAFAGRLRIAQVAEPPGGAHTNVSHLASTAYREFDEAALVAAGIDPGAVRFSIGLEDGEDIIADAHLALDSLGTVPATSGSG
ncbi:MAG TPA: aminotransferase class V-fold PLP-dependent enzyme [Streptosporangiaceae bacterium]